MDDRRAAVSKKLKELLKQRVDVAVELSPLDDTVEEVPQYSFIEPYAHGLSQ